MVKNKTINLKSLITMLFLVLAMPFAFASEISHTLPNEEFVEIGKEDKLGGGEIEPQAVWFIPALSWAFISAYWGYKAYKVWKQIKTVKTAIKTGEKLSGHKVWGTKTYKNYDGRLEKGKYKEYDVNPTPTGQNRDTERIVYDKDNGNMYYTPDHYDTFRKIE